MPELKGSRTEENLQRGFAEDTQSYSSYQYFSQIAEIEGYHDAAALLKALVDSRLTFAHGHLDYLKKSGDPLTAHSIGETRNNLKAAMLHEERTRSEQLPEMAATAHAEGFPDIASWFETLEKARRVQVKLLQDALESLQQSQEGGA